MRDERPEYRAARCGRPGKWGVNNLPALELALALALVSVVTGGSFGSARREERGSFVV